MEYIENSWTSQELKSIGKIEEINATILKLSIAIIWENIIMFCTIARSKEVEPCFQDGSSRLFTSNFQVYNMSYTFWGCTTVN
jgi:hypothetical protein